MKPETLLFALLRSAVCGTAVPEEVKAACTPDMLQQVYTFACRHDLGHLVGQVLSGMNLPESETLNQAKKAAHTALYRYIQLSYEYQQICNTLEQAQIPFIPLKGAVIRNYYPEPWLRTSCDIDILVHEEDLERATAALVKHLSYTTDNKKRYHDLYLFSPTGVHVELHFSIQENTERLDKLLCQAWEHATPVSACQYQLEHTFFLFHQIAHMAYHFTGGGCGIRPFLDIFLLNKHLSYDKEQFSNYLKICELETFYAGVLDLIDVWFCETPHTELTKKMQQYLLGGGTYGNKQIQVSLAQKKKGGTLRYLLQRIFMPYSSLRIRYRILEKHPVLYPVMLIWRWLEMLFSKQLKRSVKELDMALQSDDNLTDSVSALLTRLGL